MRDVSTMPASSTSFPPLVVTWCSLRYSGSFIGLLTKSSVRYIRAVISSSATICRSRSKEPTVAPGRPIISSVKSGRPSRRNVAASCWYFSVLMFERRTVSSVSWSVVCRARAPLLVTPASTRIRMIWSRCLTVFLA